MGNVRVSTMVQAPPATAERLWFDTSRWPSFIEGFRTIVEVSDTWPDTHSRVVWDSSPQGRGRVMETVIGYQPGAVHASEIEDPRMRGKQLLTWEPRPDGGVDVTLALEYELRGDVPKPLRPVVDALFVRRAVRDSIKRTLDSFAVEAEEEVRLG
jgi:hypothetical protein